jgi:hypothetical protein
LAGYADATTPAPEEATMSKRLWIALGLAAGTAALSGCVVVPAEPAYGYGPGYGAPVVRVVPPPVVVAPVPPPRRHYHDRRWGDHW